MGVELETGPRRRTGSKPDINITPLVDVVLVLLIIFMVVAPQMEAGAAVQLPSVLSPDQDGKSMEPTTVTLTRDGRLYLEKEELAEDVLVERLTKLHGDKPAARVVLKADTAVAYGKVRALFKRCQEIGFPGAALQVLDKANKQG